MPNRATCIPLVSVMGAVRQSTKSDCPSVRLPGCAATPAYLPAIRQSGIRPCAHLPGQPSWSTPACLSCCAAALVSTHHFSSSHARASRAGAPMHVLSMCHFSSPHARVSRAGTPMPVLSTCYFSSPHARASRDGAPMPTVTNMPTVPSTAVQCMSSMCCTCARGTMAAATIAPAASCEKCQASRLTRATTAFTGQF
jgi:hypothetical protein